MAETGTGRKAEVVFTPSSQDDYGFGMGLLAVAVVGDLVYRHKVDKRHTPKRTFRNRIFELALFGSVSYASVRALRRGMRVKVE